MVRGKWARAGSLALGLAVVLGMVSARAQQGPVQGAIPVRDYDSRTRQSGRAQAPPLVSAAVEEAQARSGRALNVRFHPLTGSVRRLTARGRLTPPSAAAPADIARAFLASNSAMFGLSEDEVGGLVLTRQYASANDTATHLTYQQVIDGIEVFEGLVGVHVARDGAIAWVTSEAMPTPRGRDRARLSAEDAISAAAADVGAVLTGDPVATKLVYFPARGGLRLAWHVYLPVEPGLRAYVVILDATSGTTLYRRNTYHDVDGVGRVFQSPATAARDPRMPEAYPTGTAPAGPDDPPAGCPPPAFYDLRSLNSAFRDSGSVLSRTGRLDGNNARIFRNRVGQWGALGAFSKGDWYFDFPFNTPDSVETALFNGLNFAHDFFYDLGFDEAAGNFQVSNFGRGGLEDDPLVAVSRASGRNNATIEVPEDGTSATMNFFLWDGRGCWAADVDGDGALDLDGGYDTDILIHEYHHGVSIRLNPAWSGDEAGAIGEGGSDFFAYSIYGDTNLAEYSAPPTGIRSINTKSYADWFCLFGFFCEVHMNGEIWANVLWDLRESFRAHLVGGSEDSAIRAIHQLYIDGLKLSPAGPTMLDLRDSMLQADLLRFPSGDVGGSENYCRLWQGFAGRGMGTGAQDTKDTMNGSVVADFRTPNGCPGPVIVTIDATAPTATEAGQGQATLTVTRSGDTAQALTVSYTVTGTATPDADYEALAGSVTIPAGAHEASIAVVPVDDTLYEPDEIIVVSLVASEGYLVGAPSDAIVTIVSDDLASDLVVSALSAPGTAAAGSSMAITETTANRGQGPADPSVTRFYLSTNLAIDAGDVAIGSRAVGTLAPGASATAVTTATIPSDMAAGTYYLLAKADADDGLIESSEYNNVSWQTTKVGADLIVSSLSAPTAAGAGQTIVVTDTTSNVGADDAGASRSRFYLSANVLLDGGDQPLGGERSVPPLGPGAASTGTTSVTLPADVAPGQYYLLAQADADGVVPETSEANNTRFAAVRIGPDLVPTALSAPGTAGAGSTVVVTDTVANQGGGSAGSSTTRFYLSADFKLDPTDTLLNGSRTVPSLEPGASSTGSTTVLIPAGTPNDQLFLLAVADADDAVTETTENNNVRYVTLTVGGDLVVSSLTVPSSTGPGASILVTDTTKNNGASGVAASVTRYYLSTDFRLSADDAPLAGGRSVPALAGGQSSTGSAAVTMPSGVDTGTYYLIAKADADGTVLESNEDNNTTFRSIVVGPDLVVSAMTAPSKAGAGEALSVTETTKNQGGGGAGASVTRFYLSPDYRFDPTDVQLPGERSVPALAGNAFSTGTTTVVIPSGTPTGAYFLIAAADDTGAVVETSEINNTRYVYVRVGPDLTVPSVSAPFSAPAGATITVTDTTANQGGGAAGPTMTRYYLSTNTVWDAGDLPLDGWRAIGPLAPGQSDTGSVTVTLPTDLTPKVYYLIVKSDGDEVVDETFETNNTRFRSLQVLPGTS